MRYLLLVLLVCGQTGYAATTTRPPTGVEVYRALLANGDIDLKTEPLCKANLDLRSQLALSLSVSYDSKNITTIKSSCTPSKMNVPQHKPMKIWDCTVQINETSRQGEFISVSSYVFSLSRDKNRFIKGSLRCY